MAAPSSLPPCDGDESWDDDLATHPPLPPPMPPLSELDHSKDGSKGRASMEMNSLEVSGSDSTGHNRLSSTDRLNESGKPLNV